jgi:RimJ/RimL family protein N-acetyltransferase
MQHFPSLVTEEQSNTGADRIQAHIEKHGWGLWAVEIPGIASFAGFIGLSRPTFEAHFTPCVEVGWRLASEYWGLGFASEGAAAALVYGFEHLGLSEIVSFTVPGNVRSRRVMERIGMTRSAADDFDHPALPQGHPLCRHILYKKTSGCPLPISE